MKTLLATDEKSQQQADFGKRSSTNNGKSKSHTAMLNKFNFVYHLRTDGIKDKGFPFIYAKVILNGNRVNLGSTGIRVRKEDWDSRSRRTRRKDVQSQADNATLDSIESQIRSIYLLFESERRLLTPNELKKRFAPERTFDLFIPKLIELYLEESEKLFLAGQVAAKTHSTRKDKLKVFLKYLTSQGKTHLTVHDIKGSLLEKFKTHMLVSGYKLSYAQKCQQFIKTMVRWAWRNDLIENDPTAAYFVKVDKTPILEHLSETELKRLITTEFPKRLQETVDCYLFACQTGLAYIDMKLIGNAKIIEDNGREYLSGCREKTNTEYFVPLSSLAKKLISRYGGIEKLPLRSNKEVNAMLKVAMAQIGVNRRIWFHTARKTFATRMQNVYLMSDETTAAMIGHKSTKELKAYRSITKERVLKEAANLDF